MTRRMTLRPLHWYLLRLTSWDIALAGIKNQVRLPVRQIKHHLRKVRIRWKPRIHQLGPI